MITLADFDPQVIAEYGITEQDLKRVIHYVRLLQGEDALTLQDIAVGGYYGTSALLHEVMELRILLARDPRLLHRRRAEVVQFFAANPDAHAWALAVEHTYLRQTIARCFGEDIPIGALIMAHGRANDFWILAEADIALPLFEPTGEEVAKAAALLTRLRQLGRRMNRCST